MLHCTFRNSSVKFRLLLSYAKFHIPVSYVVLWNESNALFEGNPSELQNVSLRVDWEHISSSTLENKNLSVYWKNFKSKAVQWFPNFRSLFKIWILA